jgi:DNA-binding transcriptional ArsR family regulator
MAKTIAKSTAKSKLQSARGASEPAVAKDTDHGVTWTFLSNHSHVIICLARDPEIRMRDIATSVGITERAVIRIVTELENGGYVKKERIGRRNRYTIVADQHFRHPLEAHHSIKAILSLARR